VAPPEDDVILVDPEAPPQAVTITAVVHSAAASPQARLNLPPSRASSRRCPRAVRRPRRGSRR
jgi:hypothetical protein